MASGIPIQSGSNGNLANVDANGNLYVNGPTTNSQAGYEAAAGVVTDGVAFPVYAPRQVRRVESTDSFRMRTGVDSTMFSATFPGSALDFGLWNESVATMTATVATGFCNLNAGNSVATTVDAIIKSYRTFPIFQDLATRMDCVFSIVVAPQANTVMEWGMFLGATTAAPTDGVLFRINGAGNFIAVVNNNGTENTQDIGVQMTAATRYEFSIIVDTNQAFFYINNELCATLKVPAAGAASTAAQAQPVCFRIYNGGSAPALANQMKIASATVTLLDGGAGRSWANALTGMGASSIQNTFGGGTTGQTANYVNVTAPTSATLSNTAAGYTTLGGQWQFAAVAGAETDYALFAFLNPTATAAVPGRVLYITGIRIDSFNMGATVATTPTLLQWGMGFGATAVTLVGTVDSAANKIVRRIALGCQSFAIGAVVGAVSGNTIDTEFGAHQAVNPGEYVHVILKMPVGTATASQIVRGVCFINGYFE